MKKKTSVTSIFKGTLAAAGALFIYAIPLGCFIALMLLVVSMEDGSDGLTALTVSLTEGMVLLSQGVPFTFGTITMAIMPLTLSVLLIALIAQCLKKAGPKADVWLSGLLAWVLLNQFCIRFTHKPIHADNLSIAGFIIFGDQELTVACARELLKKAPEYDYIITAEAKGIPLAHEMARQAGDKKYFVARKGPKLYMRDTFGVAVRSITTDKEQHLYLDGQDAKLIKGKRVLILDDVISTGESLKALEALVEKAGGIICGRMAILAEGDAKDRKDIIYLEPLPLFNADGTEK